MSKQDNNDVYKIFVVREGENVLVGSIPLDTAKIFHEGFIKTINYESKTIYLDTETPYGK